MGVMQRNLMIGMFVLVLAALVMSAVALDRTESEPEGLGIFAGEEAEEPSLGSFLDDVFGGGGGGLEDVLEFLPFEFEGPGGGFGFDMMPPHGRFDDRPDRFPHGDEPFPGDHGFRFDMDGFGGLEEFLRELFGAHEPFDPVDELALIEEEIAHLEQIIADLEARRAELESAGTE